jgi:isopenicillin-N N-acyltransferase-like protein
LTDFRDVLWQRQPLPAGVAGCTSFGLRRSRTVGDVTCIGQNWDMHASAEPVLAVFHRKPEDGPSSLTVSTAGCLSLIGMNEVGIAIGNNNLQPKDARPGVMYLALIHEALRQTHFDAACRAITEAHRSSGHNYLLADDEGTIVDIETTAELADEYQPAQPYYVHTNHYQSPRLKPLEVDHDRRSSQHRYDRLMQLFEQNDRSREACLAASPTADRDPGVAARSANMPRLGPEGLQGMLSDQDGGPELCICREGTGRDNRSCAFVALIPERREMWLTFGPPSRGTLTRFGLN